mmetsp:Transcript_24169/g.75346  ORF Transcript_24169/g.75346 Transcript_24169/m.75346 type:complete len:408 (-) Transcript_24169:121-1344(-)
MLSTSWPQARARCASRLPTRLSPPPPCHRASFALCPSCARAPSSRASSRSGTPPHATPPRSTTSALRKGALHPGSAEGPHHGGLGGVGAIGAARWTRVVSRRAAERVRAGVASSPDAPLPSAGTRPLGALDADAHASPSQHPAPRALSSRSPASSQASQPSVPVASLRPSVSAHDQLGAPDAISPQPPSSSLGANSADIDGVPFVPPPRKPVPTRDALVQQVRETAEQAERARLEKKRAEAQLRAAQDGLQRTRSHLAVDAPVLGMRAPVLAPGGLLAPHLDPLYQRGRERSVSAPPPRAVPPPPPPPPEAMALPQPPALGGLAEDESWLGEEEGAASYERHMHDLEGISVDFPDTPEARPPATGGGAGAHGGQCAPSACRGFLGANSMRSSSRAGERAGHTCESDM